MPRTFETHDFERLTADISLLVRRLAAHEHELSSLVNAIEETVRAQSRVPGIEITREDDNAGTGTTSPSPAASSQLEQIRRRYVDARVLRQVAQTVQRSINGESLSGSALDGTREPVLIIDDDADTRELLAMALEPTGLEVVTASNGLEGLFAAYCLRPAVILMDVNMPVLNGIEAARLLKSHPSTQHVHVIAQTAKPFDLEGPLGRLFAHVLSKPVAPRDVLATVQRFLDWRVSPRHRDRSADG